MANQKEYSQLKIMNKNKNTDCWWLKGNEINAYWRNCKKKGKVVPMLN
jgi:hypothetical protein